MLCGRLFNAYVSFVIDMLCGFYFTLWVLRGLSEVVRSFSVLDYNAW